uniref:Uncharacterized protein n=1 Tax=Oryza glumipatula TaxID=40148 RepID=A0A0E0ATJ5_9ORYZ
MGLETCIIITKTPTTCNLPMYYLIKAKGFNMSFNKEEVIEAIYQNQLTTRRVSASHAIAKAQASRRVTMTKDMHPISQLHQQDYETTPDNSSNNTNSIYEKCNL